MPSAAHVFNAVLYELRFHLVKFSSSVQVLLD